MDRLDVGVPSRVIASKVTEQGRRATVGWEGPPMLTAANADGTTPDGSLIDEILREGAQRNPAAPLERAVAAAA
jgi:hypothetical protein